MKIKTTFSFKARRLADYTKEEVPKLIQSSNFRFNEDNLEKEIFSSCIILKNLAIVHKDRPMSGDFILEELMADSRLLKNTYGSLLSAYRNGKSEDAFGELYGRIKNKGMKNFLMILSKIDQINPVELTGCMIAFQETFSSERVTKGMRRAEQKSILTTMIATASIFAILLNFAIVVVFMDTMATLGKVF